jgi:hypothetical protein
MDQWNGMDREGWTDHLVDWWNGFSGSGGMDQWISGTFTGMEWITDILMEWNGVEWNGSSGKAGSG